MSYNSEGRLESITDPASRKLTLAYNSEGLVESAKDPMGHTVKYTYESKNLASVTQPGEASLRWQFKYDSSHQMTSKTDGRSHAVTTEYDASHRVILQTDAMERKRKWKYASTESGTETTIAEPNGSETVEQFNIAGLPTSITHASGTSLAATTTNEYDATYNLIAITDPNKHTVKYGYNAAGDRTSETDALEHKTEWTYNATHDVTSTTNPKGETTTIKRDSHGNPEVIERPAPESKTQITKYKYTSHGELESVTNPLERTWKYEYDSKGDRTAETDPEGNRRTWGYNEDSQETSMVSPRGNVTGGEPAVFTTTIERDAQGRPLAVVQPPREPVNNSAFGSSGTGNGQFQFPTLEALTSSGSLWVSDSSLDRLQKFNEKGEYVAQFGSKGTEAGQFEFPFGIAINPSTGNIYVSDYKNYRVQEFSSSGTFIRMFGYGVSNGKSEFEICTEKCQAGLKGSGSNGQFSNPDGVAIDSSGNVWVADETNNRVGEYAENGAFIKQFGTKGSEAGQIKQPVGLAYDHGNLYVAEAGNQRVQEFTTAGVYVTKFGSEGTGNGQFKVPYAIAAGPSTNDLYVTDRENNRVEVFTSAGVFLSSFGSKGKGSYQMELPTGIVANASETLYVSDHGNRRVDNWTGLTSRTTKYTYDVTGNIETRTDPNGNKTKYTYNADNEQTKAEAANGTITETEYDGAGQTIAQTDANKHTTKYERNKLEEVTEVIDPLARKTTKEYDPVGNLTTLTDPAKRTTTYTYDAANRLTEVKYSDGKTPTIKYEYDKDNNRTSMTDGTGTTTYTYDQLDRLTEAKDGHGDITKYEYDLANQQTGITYPNGKTVTRAYDKDGRLEKVTDWLSNTTKFAYDPDSNLISTAFSSASTNEDLYAYNNSDQMSEVKMLKGTETLASLIYARDASSQIDTTINKGLPGGEITETVNDPNNRLTKAASTTYEYDPANNPTKIGAGAYKYDNASELETGPSLTYTYDELGERTKTKPTTGQTTTYGYDQAQNLTAIERPKEGEKAEIKDTYVYDGNGLRVSQTISGTTSYLTWDMTETLPSILNDGTNSYIYGPGSLPVEQISGGGTVTYLHHDQQGSTRLLTSSTGAKEASFTYDAYGNTTGTTGTVKTPLGYDGQLTSSDTGLIYLRARTYDPATAQFLSVDPMVGVTRAPYNYAGDNPLNYADRSGLGEGEVELPCVWPFCAPPPPVTEGIEGVVKGGREAVEGVWNEVTGQGGTGHPVPPGYNPETWEKGPPSRAKEPEESYWDPEGGEWHWHPPDKSHEEHWDYKAPSPWNAEWEKRPC
jgi:RHS repeat-associated protein